MDSDGTAIISDGGSTGEPFPAIQALTRDLDWPARLKIFSRRCAAFVADLLIISALSLLFLGVPMAASLTFSLWEPSGNTAPNALSTVIEHGLQAAGVITLLCQFYFYAALCESSSAQASLGMILFGLKTTDAAGSRQTFTGVLRRLTIRYFLFILLCAFAFYSINYGADFIPSLRLEMMRLGLRVAIIATSFCLCIVTEREQTLYDMLAGRLVVADGTASCKERLKHFSAALWAVLRCLNPARFGGTMKEQLGRIGAGVVSVLTAWTYVSLLSAIVLFYFGACLGLSINEIETGLKAQSINDPAQADRHFKKAIALAPGIAAVYQYYYALNDNIDIDKQEAACMRLFAVRGNAEDYFSRAKLRAKQQQYRASESDYREALSGTHGSLDPRQSAEANTQLVMLRLEAEAAKMQEGSLLPIHTTPFDFGSSESHLK